MMWAGISLGIFILLMIGMVADRVFFRDADKATPKERPFVVMRLTRLMKPLVVGSYPIIECVFENISKEEVNVTIDAVSCRFIIDSNPKVLEYLASEPMTFTMSPTEKERDELHFPKIDLTEQRLAALNANPPTAWIYFYARIQYQSTSGSLKYPLPFCWVYDRDVADHLIRCDSSIRIK